MKTSETIGKISEALAKAQGVLKNPAKDAVNPHFRSNYATLDTGLNIVREALSRHSIAFIQATRVDGDMLYLDTRLSHVSGEWIEGEYPVSKTSDKPQIIGSAMTYAKRYALFSFVGIAGEDDDDGNEANKTANSPRSVATDKQVLINGVRACETPTELDAWLAGNSKALGALPDADRRELRAVYASHRGALAEAMPEAAE